MLVGRRGLWYDDNDDDVDDDGGGLDGCPEGKRSLVGGTRVLVLALSWMVWPVCCPLALRYVGSKDILLEFEAPGLLAKGDELGIGWRIRVAFIDRSARPALEFANVSVPCPRFPGMATSWRHRSRKMSTLDDPVGNGPELSGTGKFWSCISSLAAAC